MKNDEIKSKFDIFEHTKINLESCLEDKRKIIEENKDKLALIATKEDPDNYVLGKIEPKTPIFFGLNVTENREKYPCPEIIKYEDLVGLLIRKY